MKAEIYEFYVKYRGVILGFLGGIVYALLVAAIFTLGGLIETDYVSGAMLLGTPVAIGALTVFFASVEQVKDVKFNIFQPWLSVFGWLLVSLIIAWESIICVVMLLPLYLPLASLGGYVAGVIRLRKLGSSNGGTMFSFALLPLLLIPIETQFVIPTIFHDEVDSIVINAPIEQVWQSLPNVKNIKSEELKWTFSHFIGLPKPKSSILPKLEIGAVRTSSWEEGIFFKERITHIVPQKLLAYDVLVDEQAMKIANLDTHITVGDQYFDIEKGHYALEDLNGKTRLTISTTYRMTTNVNWYGQLWANLVLDDFHYMVLNLLKDRVETNADNA